MRKGFWALALAALVGAGPAGAAVFDYADCDDLANGGTVQYVDIFESNNSGPLFGTPGSNEPTCSGNAIDFDPNGFAVGAGNPDPSGFGGLDSQLNLTIMAVGNSVLEEIQFDEAGTFQLLGGDTNPLVSFVSVDLTVRLEIELPGVLLEFQDQANQTFQIPDDFTTSSPWSLELDFLISQILDAACNGDPPYEAPVPQACGASVQKVHVVLDNTLSVYAKNGERSFIDKKDADGLSITVPPPVPEPATGALVLLGLAGLASLRRSSR